MRASPYYSYVDFTNDANQIFNHWEIIRSRETSVEEIIRRFRLLFIDGIDYPERAILSALHRIVTSQWARSTDARIDGYTLNGPLNFNGIFNRCFYILINSWWLQSINIQATTKLVNLINVDSCFPVPTHATQLLRQLVREFRQTEMYEVLQDRGQIAAGDEHPVAISTETQRPLRRIVYRYPYLYPHFLTQCDSDSGFDAVRFQQKQQQLLFEGNLNTYLIHLISRKSQSRKREELFVGNNPTNLTDEQIRRSVKQFIGPAQGSWTYKQLAQQEVDKIRRTSSCQDMKQHVHSYIASAFQFSDYSTDIKLNRSAHFSGWLETRLQEMLQNEKYERPTGHRLFRTCGEIINCLVADPKDITHRQFHSIFVSLHGNFGATFTTSLLLKIALLFQNFRNYAEQILWLLAKRFTALLKHYGTAMSNDEDVRWLVECLDTWQIALSLHFGQTDFSYLSKWVKHL